MGETGENTVPLPKSSKRSMILVGEDYLPPLKRFQTCGSQSQYEWSLSENMLSYSSKQFHSFILDAELEDSILKYNPIPSNVLPPAPLDEFLKGVLEENHKYSRDASIFSESHKELLGQSFREDWCTSLKTDCENQRNTSNRSMCFPNEPSITKIHVLTSGPRQLNSRFPSAILEKIFTDMRSLSFA